MTPAPLPVGSAQLFIRVLLALLRGPFPPQEEAQFFTPTAGISDLVLPSAGVHGPTVVSSSPSHLSLLLSGSKVPVVFLSGLSLTPQMQ